MDRPPPSPARPSGAPADDGPPGAAPDALPRRAFLADATRLLAGAGLATQLPWLAALGACAREDARRGAPFRTLTAAEARAFRAVAARILPSVDGVPGAEEAGAVHFADRALGGFMADALPLVRAGLADLDARARRDAPGAPTFAALPPARQDALLRAVERTPFFGPARALAVLGTITDPVHGGNRDGAGWRLLDVEHRASWAPPYGWYDAEEARQVAASAAAHDARGGAA